MNDSVIIGTHRLNSLVALTEEEQERGLSGVAWPPPIMSFPFKSATIRKFWMKETVSPLDIIFCRAGKVVSIHRGEPLSLKLIGPNSPTDLVVELPAGLASKRNIQIGQAVEVRYSVKTLARKFEVILKSWG